MLYRVEDDKNWIEVDYRYEPDHSVMVLSTNQLKLLPYINRISILSSTFDENIIIENGFIKLGNAKFRMEFHTTGIEETLSVFGQFFMSVELLMGDL